MERKVINKIERKKKRTTKPLSLSLSTSISTSTSISLFLLYSILVSYFMIDIGTICSNHFTTSKRPYMDARINGVNPSSLYSIKTINQHSFHSIKLKIETKEP
jgi:hypothetical protein